MVYSQTQKKKFINVFVRVFICHWCHWAPG